MNFTCETTNLNNTTPLFTSESTTVGLQGKAWRSSSIAIAVTLFFGIVEILTNLTVLLILWRQKNTHKHVTLIIICHFVNIVLASAINGTMRTSILFETEKWISNKYSPHLCCFMVICPNYFLSAILFIMPMVPAERLIMLLFPEKMARKNSSRKLGFTLVFLYMLTLVVSILPLTPLFEGESLTYKNSQCVGNINYGWLYGIVYTVISIVAITATAGLSVAVIYMVKKKLKFLATTKRRQELVKQEAKSTIITTIVLFLATVPFSISFLLYLGCGAYRITGPICDHIEIATFRVCITIQRASYTILPILFVLINPSLRLKIYYNFCHRKTSINIISLPSSYASSAHSPGETSRERRDSAGNSEDILSLPIEQPSTLSNVYAEYQRQDNNSKHVSVRSG